MKNNALSIAIVASIGLFLASISLGIAFYKTKKPTKTVSVVGLAEKDFTSDLIVWELNLNAQDMDMKQAYTTIKEQSAVVREFLKNKNIKDSEVDFKKISTSKETQYRWDEANSRSVEIFNGYNAHQTIRIESKDIAKIEKLVREISELYDQNIQISSYEPEYYYTKLADLKIEMLAEASKDARNRAETITKNAGSKLGKLKSANMGVFQITAPNSNDDYTWGGAFNTSSKEKRASINMKLTYEVK